MTGEEGMAKLLAEPEPKLMLPSEKAQSATSTELKKSHYLIK